MGAISIVSSDSQAMGRVGEVRISVRVSVRVRVGIFSMIWELSQLYHEILRPWAE
jgi:hypothetical protein